ncbi:MAG: pyruvate, phosphate dikinase [Chloroflexota bacterium]
MSNRYVYDFDAPPELSHAELTRLLGGKGANLAVMANELRLPVPPGFTITTVASTHFLEGQWPDGLDDELRDHIERLGERVGHRFGDPEDPLLVSVRSGAAVSMPGMMDTILDLGLSQASVAGLAAATGDAAFADDCLRRLREGYRTVIGTDALPDDPWQQLRAAIEAVFRSWNSERARAYRRREQISDDLGTAVTVQAMVFGNRGANSGTGVLFTRNPSTGEPTPYGDVMFDAQGEDVVAGGQQPQPIAVLEQRLPDVAAELHRHAATLEQHVADLCDIEFTIEEGRLWLLQVRAGKRSPRAALRIAIDMADDPSMACSRAEAVERVAAHLAHPPRIFVRALGVPAPLARGLPASPGVATGVIATSSDAAETVAESGRSVILVRSETSPDDVRGMSRAAGVLTARGGLASHAAVVARGWGIPAVVGAAGVRPGVDSVEIEGTVIAAGEELTIDGSTGEVFAGRLEGSDEVAPEAAILLAWAQELGIEPRVEQRTDDSSAPADAGPTALPLEGTASRDDLLRGLLIKGAATPEQLAESRLVAPDGLAGVVEALSAEALVESRDGSLRLSAEGKLRGLDLMAADRAQIGDEASAALLEAFHRFDTRMKQIVTAWQVREVAGAQAINDHADAAYDAGVLDDLAALHAETAAWLSPTADVLHRFATYASRLERALELARGGDQRFVASPRVDSYHGVWFELHEDLIRLAGRRRSDEAAAGRA